MAQSQSIASAGVKVYINNRILGICTGLEWSADNGRRAIGGLDRTTPFELAPGATSITGRIDVIRVKNDGGLEGRGIAASNANLLFEKYISIKLVERSSNKIIFKCEQATVSNQSWRVEARNIVRGSFNFIGITWENESA